MTVLPSPIPHPLDYCPWQLPGWVYQALDWAIGVEWPEGDERAVWDLADEWYAVATALAGPRHDATIAANQVLSGYGAQGAVAQAFDAAWRRVADGDDAPLHLLIAVSADMGRLVEECGCDIEAAKLEVWIELGILVVELLALSVAVALTAGAASPAAAGVIAATRMVIQQIFRKLLAQLGRKTLKKGMREATERAAKQVSRDGLRGFGRTALRSGLTEAAEESSVNLTIQGYQNSTGRRDGVNLADLGTSAMGGLAGGAAAPLAGLGRHANSRGGQIVERLGRDMGGEIIAEQAASLATGGGFIGLEGAARAAASGGTSSVVSQSDAALQARLDGRLAALDGRLAALDGKPIVPVPATPQMSTVAYGDAAVSPVPAPPVPADPVDAGPNVSTVRAGGVESVPSPVPTQREASSPVSTSVPAHHPSTETLASTTPSLSSAPTEPTPTTAQVSTPTVPATPDRVAADQTGVTTSSAAPAMSNTGTGSPHSGVSTTVAVAPAPSVTADPAVHSGSTPSVITTSGDRTPTLATVADVSAPPSVPNAVNPGPAPSMATPNPGPTPPVVNPSPGPAPSVVNPHPAPTPRVSTESGTGPTVGPRRSAPPRGGTDADSVTNQPTDTGPRSETDTGPTLRSETTDTDSGTTESTDTDSQEQRTTEPEFDLFQALHPDLTEEKYQEFARRRSAEAVPDPGPNPDLERENYRSYYESQRRVFEEDRRENLVREFRTDADNCLAEARRYAHRASQLREAGQRRLADQLFDKAQQQADQGSDFQKMADEIGQGDHLPDLTVVDDNRFARINNDVGTLATGGVETGDRSALTGTGEPEPSDRSRPYGRRGGLRPPLAWHQIDLERAMPRGDDGSVVRTADPRSGNWFSLVNDGGSWADATRGINCLDCTLSLFETWLHGRPRVAAPRTFDSYMEGDVDRPVGGEAGGPGRVERATGGVYQRLTAPVEDMPPDKARETVMQGYAELHEAVRTGGHGTFAFVINTWEGGGAHAWVALNQNGTVLYVDPQVVGLSEHPLYTHTGRSNVGNVTSLEALVVGPNGKPMPFPGCEVGVFSEHRQPSDGTGGDDGDDAAPTPDFVSPQRWGLPEAFGAPPSPSTAEAGPADPVDVQATRSDGDEPRSVRDDFEDVERGGPPNVDRTSRRSAEWRN